MKDFFKMTFATMCGIVLLSVITGILFMISLVGMIASESASTKVKDNSVFVLKMNGVINEQEAQPASTQETITEDDQEAQVTPQPMPEDPIMSDDADNTLSPNDDTNIPNDMRETEEQNHGLKDL